MENNITKTIKKRHKKSFPCHLCDKVFKSISSLNRHQHIHLPESERPYHICKVCGGNFLNTQALKKHLCSGKNQSFPCHVCEEMFPNRISFLRHQKTHSNKCNVCEKEFKNYSLFLRHFKAVHKQHFKAIVGKANGLTL